MTGSVYWPTVLVDVLLITMLIASRGRLGFVICSNSLRFCLGVPLRFHILATGWPHCRWVWIQGSVNVREVPGDASCSQLMAHVLMLSRYTKWKKHTGWAKNQAAGGRECDTRLNEKNSCMFFMLYVCPPWPDLHKVVPCSGFAYGVFASELACGLKSVRHWGNPAIIVTKLAA